MYVPLGKIVSDIKLNLNTCVNDFDFIDAFKFLAKKLVSNTVMPNLLFSRTY